MGIDFRKSLIAELERRQHELDSMLTVLRALRHGDTNVDELMANSMPKPGHRLHHDLDVPQVAERGFDLYEEIFELRQQGLSLRAIAEQVHLSHAGVWKVLRRFKQSEAGRVAAAG